MLLLPGPAMERIEPVTDVSGIVVPRLKQSLTKKCVAEWYHSTLRTSIGLKPGCGRAVGKLMAGTPASLDSAYHGKGPHCKASWGGDPAGGLYFRRVFGGSSEGLPNSPAGPMHLQSSGQRRGSELDLHRDHRCRVSASASPLSLMAQHPHSSDTPRQTMTPSPQSIDRIDRCLQHAAPFRVCSYTAIKQKAGLLA
ncbi:hypothetical protein E2P81_ATG05379 [Venturia nashicola]|nr:hypothetical protein E2P81_ATG05379 [Venturia nashicola]